MLFAAIDYLQFTRRRGSYSDEAVRRDGGRLATSENFPDISGFRPDHLFFYHGAASILSWSVTYYTSSVWSHTGIFTEDGRVIDPTTSGVFEHPLSDYFDGKSYIKIMRLDPAPTLDQEAGILDFLRNQVEARFNWAGITRLFLMIICGAHANYRFRFSADILILLALLVPFALLHSVVGWTLSVIASVYLFIVCLNTSKRRAMRQNLADQGLNLSSR
jgi:hypothetical protein